MTTRFDVPPSAYPPVLLRDEQARALATLGFAMLGGIATQALFWKAGIGLDFFVWDALAVAACFGVFRRGRPGVAAWGLAVASLLLSAAVVRFASSWNSLIAIPAALACLAALPLALTEALSLEDLGAVPARLITLVPLLPDAASDVRRLSKGAVGAQGTEAARTAYRGLLLGVPIATVFAMLLASDDNFRDALSWGVNHAGSTLWFGALSVLTAAAYLVVHVLHGPSGIASGVRSARSGPDRELHAELRPSVNPGTWTVVVSQVAIVFAVFVMANLRHLFGGSSMVQSPGGRTYAECLHSGFELVLFATILSVGLVLLGHSLVRSPGAPPPSSAPAGRALPGVEAALLALTGVTLASCWQRLSVYEDAYGASRLRLGVLVAQVFVLGVLLLTLAKVLLPRWRGYASGVVILAAVVAVAASHFNADAYVATRNLDRAAAGRWLDEDYLASLSADARPALAHPVVVARPELGDRLTAAYCAPRSGDWRELRGLTSRPPLR